MTTIPTLPLAGAGTLLRALFKGGRAGDVPAGVTTTYRLDRLDPDGLVRYNALFGYSPGSLPITFYYLLTQRAHLATMLKPEFPFRLAGMIHVENDIRERQRPDLSLGMDLTTSVLPEPEADNGARYCVLLTVGVQQGQPVFECRSRYLAVRAKRQAAGQRGQRDATAQGEVVGKWSLAANAGRRYAAVSGDWNPLHLWPWSARLLGMKAPIIHGMHTVAKAAAMIEQSQDRRLTAISARFKAPIELGSKAELSVAGAGYQVWAGNRLAVEGSWD